MDRDLLARLSICPKVTELHFTVENDDFEDDESSITDLDLISGLFPVLMNLSVSDPRRHKGSLHGVSGLERFHLLGAAKHASIRFFLNSDAD